MTTSPKSPRIPRSQAAFDKYMKAAINFLASGTPTNNGTRLGLSAAEITQAQTYLNQWYTGNPAAPGLYELHTNPNTKTKATTKQIHAFIKTFAQFFNPLLVRMSGSAAITPPDRVILNIAAPTAKRTHPRVPLSDTVYFNAKPLGGGDLHITCRVTHDSKRGSKPKGADAVELSYKLGDPAPTNPEDAAQRRISVTRAVSTLKIGASNAGQKLYLFARWINTKHPELAGPWSGLIMVYVS